MKVLISGASRGLGKALAECLHQANHDLLLIARSQKDLITLKSTLKGQAKVELLATDLSNIEDIPALFSNHNKTESPDVIINNLGIYQMEAPSTLTIDALQKQMEINLHAAIALSNCFIPFLKAQKSGLIINIGSVMGLRASATATAYSISKHALKGWTDALREEMRKENIKVTAIYPGAIDTSSWDEVENINRSRMIQAKDIALIVKDLLQMNPATLVEEIRLSPMLF